MSRNGPKRESELKTKLMKELRAQCKEANVSHLSLRHEDVARGGIPDISHSEHKLTSWWEVKHATPGFECDGRQEMTCLLLAAAAHACYFIIYHETAEGEDKKVLIVHPKQLRTLEAIHVIAGFKHAEVAQFIRRTHYKTTATN
jgi:hypothetical protein